MFTETYIEMVSKAKQIQELCKDNEWDWFVDSYSQVHLFATCKNKELLMYWLPTLEDLFRMLDVRNYIARGKDLKKDRWVSYINIPYEEFDMKETLLIVLMRDEYNKSWNPEKKKWEEINGS